MPIRQQLAPRPVDGCQQRQVGVEVFELDVDDPRGGHDDQIDLAAAEAYQLLRDGKMQGRAVITPHN